jgi:hypothetical protein
MYELQDPRLLIEYAQPEHRLTGLRRLALLAVVALVVSLFASTGTFLAEQFVAEWVCGIQMIDSPGSCAPVPK